MGDQQGRQLTKDFVGGLIVGEGSFSIVKVDKRGGQVEMRPTFALTMCDGDTMQALCDAFRAWDLAFYFYEHPQRPGPRRYYRIQVIGYKRVKRVLDALLPYLHGDKLRAAECMDEFVTSRLAENGRGWRAPFTDAQMDAYRRLKAINRPS